jgi:hypothetical protein
MWVGLWGRSMPRRSVGCCARRARMPVVRVHRVRRRTPTRGCRGIGGVWTDLRSERRAVRTGPADLGDLRRIRRRRLLLPGADRLRRDDQGRIDVPHRPRHRPTSDGRTDRRRHPRRPKVHEKNGVCQLVADSDLQAAWLVRELLYYLPQHAQEPARISTTEPPAEIVAPTHTRQRLAAALHMLAHTQRPTPRNTNIPL